MGTPPPMTRTEGAQAAMTVGRLVALMWSTKMVLNHLPSGGTNNFKVGERLQTRTIDLPICSRRSMRSWMRATSSSVYSPSI